MGKPMHAHVDMLRPSEAAVVAGVALKEMNRALDERLLPDGFVVPGEKRLFTPGACVAMAFYSESATKLTSAARMSVIREFEPKLRNFRVHAWRGVSRGGWRLKKDYLTIDLVPFVERIAAGYVRLRAAEEAVTMSPDVLDGAPVIRGTRVPVHDVAASVAADLARKDILEAYPSLSFEQVDHAVVYAEAHPLRGRPRTSLALPCGSAVVERKVARRKVVDAVSD